MRTDQFKEPPGADDFYVVPTMTIRSRAPPISFNRESQSLDNPANFKKWLECQPTMISGSIIIFYEETKFVAEDFGELINQRPLAEASAECVAFMNVLFPGWPTNSEDIPKDVDVECIGVDIAKNEATLKLKMSSRIEAALEKIERIAANVHGRRFAITISGKTVEVTVTVTTRTGQEEISESPTEYSVTSRTGEVSTACDACLDWDGMHGQDDSITISIKGASASLNGEYTRSDEEECIGGMPYFTKQADSDLRIIYDSDQEKWFVSSFDSENERSDYARCDSTALGRGYQDLGKCKRTKWWSLVGDQYQQASKMRIKNMPAVKKWFLPNGGRDPCTTISERSMGQGKNNVWHNFWEDAPSIFGGKQNKVKNRAQKYLNNAEVSWDQVKSSMKRDACDYREAVCSFIESLFDACDQLANWCGSTEKDEITKSISSGLKRHCVSDTKFTCFVGKEGSGVEVIVSAKSIFGQTDSKGDDFWSNHVYDALIVAIFLFMLVVCGGYYLRNRRNQQQTANEGNPAEYARPDEQDAVNDLSIEDVEDYKQEMDTDGENGARPNGENQPAVDGVAHSNSVVAISLKCRD